MSKHVAYLDTYTLLSNKHSCVESDTDLLIIPLVDSVSFDYHKTELISGPKICDRLSC
jgi:hypothetical protein